MVSSRKGNSARGQAHRARMFGLIEQYLSGDLSVADFCDQTGLCRSTFYRWLRVYRAAQSSRSEKAVSEFLPIELSASPALLHAAESGDAQQHGGCLLIYPNGVKLYFPESLLAEKLAAFLGGGEGDLC